MSDSEKYVPTPEEVASNSWTACYASFSFPLVPLKPPSEESDHEHHQ